MLAGHVMRHCWRGRRQPIAAREREDQTERSPLRARRVATPPAFGGARPRTSTHFCQYADKKPSQREFAPPR